MLQPKTKFRRQQKGRMKGMAQRETNLLLGHWNQATESCWLTGRQIEAARQAVTRYMKRGTALIRVFPDKPYTKTC